MASRYRHNLQRDGFGELLAFKAFAAPILIQFVFWFGSALCIIIGAYTAIQAAKVPRLETYLMIQGLLLIVIGPLYLRILSEVAIVLFRIYEELRELNLKHDDRDD